MFWKGKEIVTRADFVNGIGQCSTPEESQEFLRMLLVENPHAKEEIGYLAGDHDIKTKHRIFEWFGVEHPIFGHTDPTSEQAMAAGIACGEAVKAGKSHEEALRCARDVATGPIEEAKKILETFCGS
jgi:hypothetical protein